MKRILSIQDLSCLGKCSLTVALPILSAMGHSVSVLPTAMLSTHTAFPNPVTHSFTGSIAPMADHWLSIGARFDVITVGYLSDPAQAAEVAAVLDRFPDAIKVVDPAMGDDGKLYSNLPAQQVDAMLQLCRKANYIVPNLTEACLLTGQPYCIDPKYQLAVDPFDVLFPLLELGVDGAVITGVPCVYGSLSVLGATSQKEYFATYDRKFPIRLHGTGDMFTAVFAGALAQGKALHEAVMEAVTFINRVLQNTPEASPFGANFESCLGSLCK